jgi:hypothetical protein
VNSLGREAEERSTFLVYRPPGRSMIPQGAQMDAGKSHLRECLRARGHAFEYLPAIVSKGGSDPANAFPERGVTFEFRPARARE